MTLFLENKYTSWYYSIIENARFRELLGYKERHHIIPKSLGGSNCKSNLVSLTAREHFVCHLLLVKMTVGEHKQKMSYALWLICNLKNKSQEERHLPLSMQYQSIRKQHAAVLSSKLKGVKKNYSYWKNKKHTNETKKKQSLAKLGSLNPMWNKKPSQETIEKSRKAQINIPKPKFVCDWCSAIVGGRSNFLRWHDDNCKHKEITP